jgi:hypothetical protein
VSENLTWSCNAARQGTRDDVQEFVFIGFLLLGTCLAILLLVGQVAVKNNKAAGGQRRLTDLKGSNHA